MNHTDHVRLIERGITPNSGGQWADLGAGAGAFTLALRDIAGPDVEITAIDRDRRSLQTLRRAMEDQFPGTRLRLIEADFMESLDLHRLDGLVIANALHYVRDQQHLLGALRTTLAPAGRVIVVEYDTDHGNRWVPYPRSAGAALDLLQRAGFHGPRIIGQVPSRFLGSIYAIVAFAPERAGEV